MNNIYKKLIKIYIHIHIEITKKVNFYWYDITKILEIINNMKYIYHQKIWYVTYIYISKCSKTLKNEKIVHTIYVNIYILYK